MTINLLGRHRPRKRAIQ